MKRRILFYSAAVVLLMMALAACSPAPETQAVASDTPQVPTATQKPENTPENTPTTGPTQTEAPTEEPTAEPTDTAEPTPVVYMADNMPEGINPLTGLPVQDPSFLQRRPVSVKINLYPRDYYRPAIGLNAADLVFDYYHNDGYTRLHTIFYGNTASEVGPIRSGRNLDAKLMRMYKSFLAFGNADEMILEFLTAADLYQRLLYATGHPCPANIENPLCRFDPDGYDYLVADIELVHQRMAAKGVDDGPQDLKGFSFAVQPAAGGKAVSQMYTHYSNDDYNRWDYDPTTNRYLRFQDAVYANGAPKAYVPLIDRVDNQQISAANVVYLFVRHDELRAEPYGIYDVMLNGSGRAVVFRDGQMYEAVWFLPSPTAALSLTMPDGSPFYLLPGNTWFQVIGTYSTVTEDQPGVVSFKFELY